ncbi:uncharacterized protein TM35_000054450 [Trypanosoma theileri]|uniref:Uncharacterized protein n=1 Tax=Trypanosoma theileri TaxID=67003 RepID=A0A1X0P5M4_9TRYP|nr:uncharacterized protein TM35_000054450 [Trypanosoma theileri]ORC91849.1 hypothetical protein TM35_000054450 [Trypanosoma theileri]
MWGQTEDISGFSYQGQHQQQQQQQQQRYLQRTNDDDNTMCPSLNDFSHIIEAAHITLSTTGIAAQSFNVLNFSASDQPSLSVDSVTEGLLTPRKGCSRCAHLGSIRETLKSVESSYLEEISQLKRMINQIDSERVDAVNRSEKILSGFDRCRQQILSKDHEIQVLRGQLRQVEDNLQRSEYEIASMRHLHMRDVAFFNQREILFFSENEQYARAAILSLEANCWSEIFTKFMNEWSPIQKMEGLSLSCRWQEVPGVSLIGSNNSSGIEEHSSFGGGLSPSPVQIRSPSITRYAETTRVNNMGVLKPAFKGGLLTELRESKRNADELNEKLQCELTKKETLISNLKHQLSIREESIRRLSQESTEGEKLNKEMQEEIDDMLRTEVLLTQKCERHSLETQAMEERLEVLYFFIRQNTILPEKHIDSVLRTPEKQTLAALKLTPKFIGTPPNLFNGRSMIESSSQCSGNGLSEDVAILVSRTVEDTVQKVMQGHLLPLKLSVESIRASSDELHRTMRKAVEDSYHHEDPSKKIIEELKKEFGGFITDIKDILQSYTTIVNTKDEKVEIANLRSTLKKVARLMSHNAKVMDDKLNDILLCQSAVARQRAVSDVISSVEGKVYDIEPLNASSTLTSSGVEVSTTVSPVPNIEKTVSPKSKHVRFDLTHYDSSLTGEKHDNTLFNTSVPLSHEWDVEVSDDETVPSPPASSIKRRTPYDIDDA